MKVLKVGPVLLYLALTCFQSDHPVLNSRYLLFEAQQAYYYGLSANLALSAVTSTPAKVLGLDHRVGFIREGVYRRIGLGVTYRPVWCTGYDAGKRVAKLTGFLVFTRHPQTL